MVGAHGVGKTALLTGYFEGRVNAVELRGSYPSKGSNVGYVPAPETGYRKDLILPMGPGGGATVVTIEATENPGERHFNTISPPFPRRFRRFHPVLRCLQDEEISVTCEGLLTTGATPSSVSSAWTITTP